MDGTAKRIVAGALLLSLAWASASAYASPAVNSAIINIRIFNDDPNSVVTTANNYPVSLSIEDTQLNGPGGFANRHNFRLSDNGGVSEAVFLNGDGFDLFTDVTLTGPANSEGGLNVAPWYSQAVDGVFTAITFNGEIAAFGGRLPFYSFNFHDPPVTYTKGETIRLGVKYRPNCLTEEGPATIEYIVIKDGVTFSSGPRSFDQANPNEDPPYGLWGMLNDARVGGYFQPQINSADPNNSGRVDFENISYDADPPAGLGMDIKPGSCPNPFNRSGHGVLPVALLGTVDSDATAVDISTVRLSRADGVGGSVAPHEGPPGPHSVFEDVGTPFDGCGCDCHGLTGDGIDDLSLKFKSDDVTSVLELDNLSSGSMVALVLTGNLLDGTPFATPTDCIWLVPPGGGPAIGALNITANQPEVWVEAVPMDVTIDGGGFTDFVRHYALGTTVTVTAPEFVDSTTNGPRGEVTVVNGYRFRYWKIDGVAQPIGQRTIVFNTLSAANVEAIYVPVGPLPAPTPTQGLPLLN